MNLKVNNCGECPFGGKDNECKHPNGGFWISVFLAITQDKVDERCPLKTSPITIKIEEKRVYN